MQSLERKKETPNRITIQEICTVIKLANLLVSSDDHITIARTATALSSTHYMTTMYSMVKCKLCSVPFLQWRFHISLAAIAVCVIASRSYRKER